jgi:hypothetical protein
MTLFRWLALTVSLAACGSQAEDDIYIQPCGTGVQSGTSFGPESTMCIYGQVQSLICTNGAWQCYGSCLDLSVPPDDLSRRD